MKIVVTLYHLEFNFKCIYFFRQHSLVMLTWFKAGSDAHGLFQSSLRFDMVIILKEA